MQNPFLRWHFHLNRKELTLAKVSQKTSSRKLQRKVQERFLGANMGEIVTCDKLYEYLSVLCWRFLYRSRTSPGMLFSTRYNPIFGLTFMGRGSRCYFPVFIQGANLSVGDLHFSQGDVSLPFWQLYLMLISLHRVKWVLCYKEGKEMVDFLASRCRSVVRSRWYVS